MVLAGGDARMMLNGLETVSRMIRPDPAKGAVVTAQILRDAFQRRGARYDKEGEEHYNIISAFIKSLRGSDPDAAVYWLARMLEGGEDPKFIARRMVVLASEDVGNADPRALMVATSCFAAVDTVGMPEARIILAQGATYLASAPKSNASYLAIEAALAAVRKGGPAEVPLHLRNAPTDLMKHLRYGAEYRYSHDAPGHFVEQQYLPDALAQSIFYRPSDQGEERTILERLNAWWTRRRGRA
jgi:putative ATPase